MEKKMDDDSKTIKQAVYFVVGIAALVFILLVGSNFY
jgi:uncharacterized membrane protein YuzA (DUF378 family)